MAGHERQGRRVRPRWGGEVAVTWVLGGKHAVCTYRRKQSVVRLDCVGMDRLMCDKTG